ncbi:hypothetical protein B7463_g2968, partial [Scytalidium lignicola]
MADPLYELLVPYFDSPSTRPPPSSKDPITAAYLNRIATLPLSSLSTTEPQSLSQSSHSLLLSLQALSKRSHKSVIESSNHLSTLPTTLPQLASSTFSLLEALPKLDSAAVHFSETYNPRSSDSELLARRKQALLLSRNIDRLTDILDLPTLLSTAISSSSSLSSSSSTTITSTAFGSSAASLNYASALDLNAHIRRLHNLYPNSRLVSSISAQAEEEMHEMATNLIASLKPSSLKLASAMRTISWLRRVAPELAPPGTGKTAPIGGTGAGAGEGSIGSLFLVCRLANLTLMLSALEPLRELADQETVRLVAEKTKLTATGTNGGRATAGAGAVGGSGSPAWSSGQQTERYLKRYIEIFREQSFAIVSMYRSIFPAAGGSASTISTPTTPTTTSFTRQLQDDPLNPLPSPLSTFPLHLIGMLEEVLRLYLPNVRDRVSRDSLLTQVLYCAGSLGRLGGDFSGLVALLGIGFKEENEGKDGAESDEGEEEEEEWVEVVKKHRVLAGRLESMVVAR